MNSPVKLVIFDWDGTLFDSVGQIVSSLQFAAQQFQQPLTDADAKSIMAWVYQKSHSDYSQLCQNYMRIFCRPIQIIMWRIQ
jgi:Predicted phosphatases